MPDPNPPRLVLHNRTYLSNSPQQKLLRLVVMLIIAIIIASAILLYLIAEMSCGIGCLQDALRETWNEFNKNPLNVVIALLAPLILVLQIAYFELARKRERLILSETGIQYLSPLPNSLKFLHPDWSLQWSAVSQTWIKPLFRGAALHQMSLVLETGVIRKKIRLFPWVDPLSYRPRSLWTEVKAVNKSHSGTDLTEVFQGPIMTYIGAHVQHLQINSEFVAKNNHYALHKNPWAAGLIIIFFVLVAYAVIESFFGLTERYAEGPFYVHYVGSGVVFAALASGLLGKQGVPEFEAIVIAGLSGLALGCALHPGLLRLNQLSDFDSLQPYEYRLVSDKQFAPLREGPPVLKFRKSDEYWAQLRVGSTHQFELRRGGLGFYQLNIAPIERKVRNYYRAVRNEDTPQ